jgi:hypothetical protein
LCNDVQNIPDLGTGYSVGKDKGLGKPRTILYPVDYRMAEGQWTAAGVQFAWPETLMCKIFNWRPIHARDHYENARSFQTGSNAEE